MEARVLPSLIGLFVAVHGAASDTAPPVSCAARRATSSPVAFVAVAASGARDTVVRAMVCVRLPASSKAKIGSYHGELHFDSTSVGDVHVQKAEGGMRVENATIPGQVNFAGAAPAGFPDGALVSVVLRLRTPGVRPTLRLQLMELNTTEGADLMKHLTLSPPTP
ncbi:MAG TPA: hypothetical protein VJ867_09450 [Gemmatimonadaceae bacterium]|nr:hypothetical protein [Gemmatimonadaceae bacterium]